MNGPAFRAFNFECTEVSVSILSVCLQEQLPKIYFSNLWRENFRELLSGILACVRTLSLNKAIMPKNEIILPVSKVMSENILSSVHSILCL